ncbi:MAG TPA: flagellar hook-length control protein FliK [Cellvibrio sp.]|nr:flagellar hook-length control protein FliK [Cellvibrio sp.]
MNSSSAFSNLLPTVAAQPATQSSSPRKGEADTAKAEFKKALDGARTEQDIKPKERPAKKLAAADKDAKTAGDNNDCAARRSAKAEKPQVAAAEKAEPARNKPEETSDTESEGVLLVTDPGLTTDTAAVLPSLPLSLEVTTGSLVEEGELVAEVVGEPAAGTTSQLLALDDQGEVQAPMVETVDATAALGPLANAASAAAGTEPDAEILVTGAAVPLKNTAQAGAAPELQLDVEASADESDSQSAVANDTKALFEKMLQAMTGNAGNNASGDGAQPDAQAQDKTNGAAPVAAASPLESLARLETQSPAARSFVVQTAVPVALGQPNWSQAVGEKVLWLAAQNVQSAEIRLDPPELGPMQVKVSVQQEQATVSFTSHHAGVREALDQSLGRLRDMFNEQGLNLVNVDVSDRSFQRQQGDGESQRQGSGGGHQEDEEEVVAVSTITQQRLVDHYA